MSDIRRQLEVMLDVLDEKEWIQDDLFQGSFGLRGDQHDVPLADVTGVCLAGAYSYALVAGMLARNDWFGVSQALLAAIKDLFPDRPCATIPYFNDDKATTREDIILVVKTAIERASDAAK